ncbi:DUF1109 domain-containing protein [Shewanella canadensis]|uniref:DUF1109 domain-containing protein n=1 Tax=Shewanella canadensis TaxID=271096 RepID=A0A431WUT5_9GAMM|nr:NrsF family protein [Shewanella canadensis]RTR39438.1 DUF1109 domain-containing protein [Shewanella canadensis]
MNKHDLLIANLSRNLAPVPPAPNINRLAMFWFCLSAIFVVVIIHLMGPVRPGAFAQLVEEPRFLLESLMGVTAIIWICQSAFRAAIPGALTDKFFAFGIMLMVLWLAQYLIGLGSPALDPSMAGKRGHCFFETMLYSLPLILSGQLLVRRLYPLRPIRTAMSVSLAAGMMPALYMQLACMYEPSHILTYHILPGLLMVPTGAAIAMLWLPHRNAPNATQI